MNWPSVPRLCGYLTAQGWEGTQARIASGVPLFYSTTHKVFISKSLAFSSLGFSPIRELAGLEQS